METDAFTALGLDRRVALAMHEIGLTEPLPIQRAAIPAILAGRDVVGSAETGSGKTLAYLAPLYSLLVTGPRRTGIRVLVLVPTRELAIQVAEVAAPMARSTRNQCYAAYGGVALGPQVEALGRGVPVLIATPGRLLDLMKRGHVRLNHVGAVVLDEADRMLEMGFVDEVRRIVSEVPVPHQTLLFSATIHTRVERFAREMSDASIRIQSDSPERPPVPEGIRHQATVVRQPLKLPLLVHLLHDPTWESVLVFTRTRFRCAKLAEALRSAGISADALHSDRTQAERTSTLDRFRRSELQALVATDVAERGLDIPTITHVVHFDLPRSPQTWLHRSGRTARVFGEGTSITFVAPDEVPRFRRLADAAGVEAAIAPFSGFDADQRPPSKDPLVEPPSGRPRKGRDRDADAPSRPRAKGRRGQPAEQTAFWNRVRDRRRRRGGPDS